MLKTPQQVGRHLQRVQRLRPDHQLEPEPVGFLPREVLFRPVLQPKARRLNEGQDVHLVLGKRGERRTFA